MLLCDFFWHLDSGGLLMLSRVGKNISIGVWGSDEQHEHLT